MQHKIYDLKKAVFELEKSIAVYNKNNLEKTLDNIISICNDIKKATCDNTKLITKFDLKKINSIPFIYKPVTRIDYLSGNYLEQFSEERTNELKEAEAIDAHNEFWIQHQTIKGNIFGSMPKELLNVKAIKTLEKNRWDTVLVNIYEPLERNVQRKELIEYCEEKFEYYILLQEKSTKGLLILQYCI